MDLAPQASRRQKVSCAPSNRHPAFLKWFHENGHTQLGRALRMKCRPRINLICDAKPVASKTKPALTVRRFINSAIGMPLLLSLAACLASGGQTNSSALSIAAPPVQEVFTNAGLPLRVTAYRFVGDPALTNIAPAAGWERFVGSNVTLVDIVKAASSLQDSLHTAGFTNVTLTVGRDQITRGVVTFYGFRGALAQIVVDGRRCSFIDTSGATPAVAASPSTATNAATAKAANAPSRTNSPPGFPVRAYEIQGDTLLSTKTLLGILEKYTGTNITVTDILQAGSDLQSEYRRRGYAAVNVTIPPQKLDSNAIVKIRVFEGRLAEVNVLKNRYFTSNNVMRALPSLRTNMILIEPIFQAELDRANANQDRQIYPQIGPGPVEGTTTLDLNVKDRLPLHAKLEFNNYNSPGTPDLRLNASAVYNNLWQYEHSFGVQYSFSPEAMKEGDWPFYDRPAVANYSGFYRLPLGNAPPISDVIVSRPGTFGFNEASRQFQLPPPSGRAELNLYASRSTIDTGLQTLDTEYLVNVPNVRSLTRQDVQEDLTVNEDVGFRLSAPLATTDNLRSTLSGGLDFKTYSLTSSKTNEFLDTEITINPNGSFNPPRVTPFSSAVPLTQEPLNYLPLALRYDGSLRDKRGMTFFGLGLAVNTFYSGSSSNLQTITGSTASSGHWVTVTPSISHDFNVYTNWVLSLRADGQWASEALISAERFGAGGVNSVRGYHEGEVFGDNGWRVSAEQRTPAHLVGLAWGKNPMTVRGAVFMDYAEVYSLEPNSLSRVPLWGTGLGGVLSIGTHWEARLLFAWPLLSAGSISAYEPRFNFSLSGQF